MTSYFMSLGSTAQVTGRTRNFTLTQCRSAAQDLAGLLGLTIWRCWNVCTLLGGGAPRASSRSAKFSWSVKGNLCRCDSLQRLGQGRLGCQAALSAQHFRHASFAPKNLPLRLSLQEVHISWVSLWVSSSNRTKKKLKQSLLWTLWVSPDFSLKELPPCSLETSPCSHAVQLRSSAAVQKGLSAPWEGHEPFCRL